MARRLARGVWLAAIAVAIVVGSSARASASPLSIGFISWDVNFPGNAGQFDIINMSGPNSTGDALFPSTTTVSLGSLSLLVDFSDGSSHLFGSSYFTLGLDGISFDGSAIPIGGANPKPKAATLTGSFSSLSLTLFDGSTVSILPTFTASILPSSGTVLSDGDLAIISAETTTGGPSPVPEPGTLVLVASGLLGVLRKKREGLKAMLASGRRYLPGAGLAFVALLVPATSQAAVNLNSWTAPDNGVAGVNNVSITGSPFPA